MKPAARHVRVVLWLLASAGLMLATAGVASAQPPITGTDVSTFSESFSDEPFLCQDELYAQTVSGHSLCTSPSSRILGRFTSMRTCTARS
jgi:hypothetical protein